MCMEVFSPVQRYSSFRVKRGFSIIFRLWKGIVSQIWNVVIASVDHRQCTQYVVKLLYGFCVRFVIMNKKFKKIVKNEAEHKTNERIGSPSYGNSTILKNLVDI